MTTDSDLDNQSSDSSLWGVCDAAAPIVGDVTGAVYGFGGAMIAGGGNPVSPSGMAGGAAVASAIGGFVEDNWPDVCALPGNVVDAFSDVGGGDLNPGGISFGTPTILDNSGSSGFDGGPSSSGSASSE